MTEIILASKSKVRKEILDNHNINSKVEASKSIKNSKLEVYYKLATNACL